MKDIILFIIAMLLISYVYISTSYDDTDDKANSVRSGMILYTDHKTGCQYLSGWTGVLIPRVNANGEHICGNL